MTMKPDKKTIEKNRRLQMKGLCKHLVSLIPSSHFNPPKELLSQRAQLEQAADYIAILRSRVEKLRLKKMRILATNGVATGGSSSDLPLLKVTNLGPNVEVLLIRGVQEKGFIVHRIISILDEEGADVVAATVSNNGDQIVHTFHAQVKSSRVGVGLSRLCERLQELIS